MTIEEHATYWLAWLHCPCGCGGYAGSLGCPKDGPEGVATREEMEALAESRCECRKGKLPAT